MAIQQAISTRQVNALKRADINGVNQGIKNSDRASSVIATTEGGLAEVNDLLNSIKALLVESANTGASSKDERAANQLQIDSILQTIDRVASSTSFQGSKLLNGNFDFKAESIADGVADFRVNAAKFKTIEVVTRG